MYLSSRETQKRMGISRETLRKLIRSGELKAHKVGTGRTSPIKVSEASIEDYMERHVVVPQA
jgi:excisionase family DNA binding protein